MKTGFAGGSDARQWCSPLLRKKVIDREIACSYLEDSRKDGFQQCSRYPLLSYIAELQMCMSVELPWSYSEACAGLGLCMDEYEYCNCLLTIRESLLGIRLPGGMLSLTILALQTNRQTYYTSPTHKHEKALSQWWAPRQCLIEYRIGHLTG